MKLRRFTISFLALGLLLLALPTGAQEQLPACIASIRTFADCPDEGCGGGGDGPLNRMKNRTTQPADPEERTLGFIRGLRQPTQWTTGQD
ncbi:MAG: hypothetical protein LC802_12565, partial [Acidobacteria bacterium]|nr:hypothetical protein [Acidobacteriota bacterium]